MPAIAVPKRWYVPYKDQNYGNGHLIITDSSALLAIISAVNKLKSIEGGPWYVNEDSVEPMLGDFKLSEVERFVAKAPEAARHLALNILDGKISPSGDTMTHNVLAKRWQLVGFSINRVPQTWSNVEDVMLFSKEKADLIKMIKNSLLK